VASVTHPLEKRKFTLGELRALSSFPNNFDINGNVGTKSGNESVEVVPPLLAKAKERESD
jgi:site-specific DNA-cytosine methylase